MSNGIIRYTVVSVCSRFQMLVKGQSIAYCQISLVNRNACMLFPSQVLLNKFSITIK